MNIVLAQIFHLKLLLQLGCLFNHTIHTCKLLEN